MKLYNNDCLEVINNFRGGQYIIVTDPPFNVGYHYNEYKDTKTEEDYFNWLEDIIGGSAAVIIHYPESLYKLSYQLGRFPDKVVSWVYNSNTSKQHRDICFFGVNPDFNKVRQPYKNINDKRIQERIKNGSKGAKLYDWFEVNQVKNVSKEKTIHPCQMPLDVMEKIIGLLPEGKTIIDPFMGSGTTGVACKKLNRDFIGIELNKDYFELAKKRIENTEVQSEFNFS